jgi:hypothetical protein
MLLRDAVTGTGEARRRPTGLRRRRTAGRGGQCHPGGIFPERQPVLEARMCARCGVRFRRTPSRWLTCQRCYLANSELEPIATRASLSLFWTRADRPGRES